MCSIRNSFKPFFFILLTIFVFIFLESPTYSKENPKQNILILNSYHKGLKWSDDMMFGIEDVLKKSDTDVIVIKEYMDATECIDLYCFDLFCNLYKHKYSNSNFSAIIVTDNEAFDFISLYGEALFPKVPVIFCGVNGVSDSIVIDKPLFTGVLEEIDISDTISTALRLHPDTKQIIVLNSDDPSDVYLKESIEKLEPNYSHKINFIYMNNINFINDKNKLKTLSQNSIIILGNINKNNLNNYASIEDIAHILSENTSIPIYTPWETCVTKGVVGGKMLSPYSMGESAGALTVKVLKGESPKKIPILKETNNKFVFDYIELSRFNVSINHLPPNSKIKNLTLNSYKVPKHLLWIFLFILIGTLFYLIKSIKRKKETNKTLEEIIEYDNIKNQFFSNISHELKTPLNIILSALQYCDLIFEKGDIHKSEVVLKKYKKMARQNSYRLLRTLDNLIDVTRLDSSDFQLNLANHDIINLTERITLAAASFISNTDLEVIFDTDTEEKIIACDPYAIERILLNLLSNSIKFTKAPGSIWVNIYVKDNFVEIIVQDTGIGIPKDKQEIIFDKFTQIDKSLRRDKEGSGMGLSLVKSLVELHKGTISVRSVVGKGSEFIITLPNYVIPDEFICKTNAYLIRKNSKELVKIEFSDIYF